MTYWFIFCKTDLLLQKQADGSYTIPCSEESPIALKPWAHVLNISPMEDGTEVKAFTIDTPVTDNPNYEPEFGISDCRFSCYARFPIGAYYICPPNNMDGKMQEL